METRIAVPARGGEWKGRDLERGRLAAGLARLGRQAEATEPCPPGGIDHLGAPGLHKAADQAGSTLNLKFDTLGAGTAITVWRKGIACWSSLSALQTVNAGPG